MGWNPIAPITLALLAALLLAAGIEDARHRTIGHAKVLAIIALAPLFWASTGLAPWPGMAVQAAIGLGVLVLFLVPFALGWMAAGDVKLLAALALWLPAGQLLPALQLVALAGGAVTLPFWIQQRRRGSREPVEVPYGVAIAMGGLLILREPIINQFG